MERKGAGRRFGELPAAEEKWAGGVLAGDGKIYCVPWAATEVLVIDPVTRTLSTFGSVSPLHIIISSLCRNRICTKECTEKRMVNLLITYCKVRILSCRKRKYFHCREMQASAEQVEWG